jgi:hypothetical protein
MLQSLNFTRTLRRREDYMMKENRKTPKMGKVNARTEAN